MDTFKLLFDICLQNSIFHSARFNFYISISINRNLNTIIKYQENIAFRILYSWFLFKYSNFPLWLQSSRTKNRTLQKLQEHENRLIKLDLDEDLPRRKHIACHCSMNQKLSVRKRCLLASSRGHASRVQRDLPFLTNRAN